jgi:hypothetical protein
LLFIKTPHAPQFGPASHGIQICSAYQHYICVIQFRHRETAFHIQHPAILALEREDGMKALDPMIESLLTQTLLIPRIPALIFYDLDQESSITQAFVTSCVPRLPTRMQACPGFTKVCTEFVALCASPAPIPPTAAFFYETKVACV